MVLFKSLYLAGTFLRVHVKAFTISTRCQVPGIIYRTNDQHGHLLTLLCVCCVRCVLDVEVLLFVSPSRILSSPTTVFFLPSSHQYVQIATQIRGPKMCVFCLPLYGRTTCLAFVSREDIGHFLPSLTSVALCSSTL